MNIIAHISFIQYCIVLKIVPFFPLIPHSSLLTSYLLPLIYSNNLVNEYVFNLHYLRILIISFLHFLFEESSYIQKGFIFPNPYLRVLEK